MTDRADPHTNDHDQWDQGDYCNNLVTDDDGCGTICGHKRRSLCPEMFSAEGFEEHLRLLHAGGWSRNSTPGRQANVEFDRFMAKVRSDALREVATAFIDWDVLRGDSPETKKIRRLHNVADWLMDEADRWEASE